jgi:hypothetical protein
MVTPQSRASPISPLKIFPPADLIHRRTDGAEWATLLRVSRRQSNRDMEPLRVQRSHHLVASMLNGRLPSISRLTRRSPVVHGLFRPKRIQPNRSTPNSVNSDTANYLRAACPREIFLSKSWTEWSRSAASCEVCRSSERQRNYCDKGNSFAINIPVSHKPKPHYVSFQQPRQPLNGSIGFDPLRALRAVFQNMVSDQQALPSL